MTTVARHPSRKLIKSVESVTNWMSRTRAMWNGLFCCPSTHFAIAKALIPSDESGEEEEDIVSFPLLMYALCMGAILGAFPSAAASVVPHERSLGNVAFRFEPACYAAAGETWSLSV